MTDIRPSPTDGFPTETSKTQAETEKILLAHALPTPPPPVSPPTLTRNAHLQFLVRNLTQGFPVRYTSQDASQPWLLFWTLQGFSVLQVGLDPNNKQRAIDTIMQWQHPNGGFGGGPGQAPHLLPTYASICALAIVGRPGPKGGWDQIDRDKLYKFFMSLKQPDGSFLVAHHAEVDVRGIYCLLVSALLTNLLTPELVKGTASFIASCQTYEGGFSSASQPYFSPSNTNNTSGTQETTPLLASPRPPLGEAHGGYTFCAVASWVILQPFIALPSSSEEQPHNNPKINTRTLLRWLVQMQGSAIELGGFKGRTNKLVDGCYSWWVGGAFGLLEALGVGPSVSEDRLGPGEVELEECWVDGGDDHTVLNREALQEYILLAGQHPAGGLRDKPPKGADAYHTLYCLSGLSSAQHHVYPSPERRDQIADAWKDFPEIPLDGLRKSIFADALSWTEEEGASTFVGGTGNRVNATHPLFNLTMTHTEGILSHFYGQNVPARVRRKEGKATTAAAAVPVG